jgi:hypothetical protein
MRAPDAPDDDGEVRAKSCGACGGPWRNGPEGGYGFKHLHRDRPPFFTMVYPCAGCRQRVARDPEFRRFVQGLLDEGSP